MARADADRKVVHMAAKVNAQGGISPYCYAVPRALNLKQATWTMRPDDVTCARCKTKLDQKAQAHG